MSKDASDSPQTGSPAHGLLEMHHQTTTTAEEIGGDRRETSASTKEVGGETRSRPDNFHSAILLFTLSPLDSSD